MLGLHSSSYSCFFWSFHSYGGCVTFWLTCTFWRYIYIHNSNKKVIKWKSVFSYYFCLMTKGSGPRSGSVQIMMDPDLTCQKLIFCCHFVSHWWKKNRVRIRIQIWIRKLVVRIRMGWMRSSRVIRASPSQCWLSWVHSQHPPKQRNLRGGRWSSVKKKYWKSVNKNPPKYLSIKSVFSSSQKCALATLFPTLPVEH